MPTPVVSPPPNQEVTHSMGPLAISARSSRRASSLLPAPAVGSPSCSATAGNTAWALLSAMQFSTALRLPASSSCGDGAVSHEGNSIPLPTL